MILYVLMLLQAVGLIAVDEKNSDLHRAVLNNDYVLVKELLEEDADPNTQNSLKQTPLHYAAHTGNVAIADLLIAYGAEVNAQDIEESTPLHYAARKDFIALAQLLCENGADIGTVNCYKVTPMYIACHSGSQTVVKYFIARGANLDERDSYGASLMVCAAERNATGNVYTVDLLHYHGVSLTRGDCDGNTPLHAVIQTGAYGALLALVALRANPAICNNKGQTPADIAIELGYDEIAAALRIYEKSFQRQEATLAGQ